MTSNNDTFDKSVFWRIDDRQEFQIKNIYSDGADLSKFDSCGPRKRIAIIGSGIAGLSAAHELSQLQHEVTIFERDTRLGGRILSHTFASGLGLYGDLGPMRIPETHNATLRYCKKFGLNLATFVNRNDNAFLLMRNHLSRLGTTSQQMMDSYNLRTEERFHPFELLAKIMLKEITMLDNHQRFELFHNNLTSSKVKDLDDCSLHQRLRQHLSPGAIDYVLSATALLQYQHMSFKAVLMDWWGLFDIQHFRVEGGTQKLIDAFKQNLNVNFRLDSQVECINITGNSVRVLGNLQPTRTLNESFDEVFDQVIVAIPARATASIRFSPPLHNEKHEALANLTQVSSGKTLMLCKRRFWELNDNIYGGGSFTDLPIQSVWYPSDNAAPVSDGVRGAVQWQAADEDRSHEPAVLTAAYLWGNNARYMKSLGDEGATEEVLKALKFMHGNTIENDIEDVVHWHWDEHCGLGGGSFGFFQPGEHQRYQKALAAVHPIDSAPKIFFAGEHIAVVHAWIETAIQSAHLAVARIISS